jgi:hypothetical protein
MARSRFLIRTDGLEGAVLGGGETQSPRRADRPFERPAQPGPRQATQAMTTSMGA